jgi:hypothetical protein
MRWNTSVLSLTFLTNSALGPFAKIGTGSAVCSVDAKTTPTYLFIMVLITRITLLNVNLP